MLDYKKLAESDLRGYNNLKAGLENLRNRVEYLNDQLSSSGYTSPSTSPIHGGGTKIEDKIVSLIAERDRMRLSVKAKEPLLDMIERGLEGLTERERKVLEAFYINRLPRAAERLMEEWYVEKSRVYQIKDEALERFTVRMYGMLAY